MKCNFCAREQESPCRNPMEAAMTCGVDEAAAMTAAVTPAAPVGGLTDFYGNPITAAVDPDIYQESPTSAVTTTNLPRPGQWPAPGARLQQQPQVPDLYFNPAILALLKEAQKENEFTNIDDIWNEAQVLAEEFEVVMQPTIKRKKK